MFTPIIKLEYSDARGEIYSIALPGDRELMLLHSVEGSLRGGHCHDVDEVVMVLTGSLQYWKRTEEGSETTFGMYAGESVFHRAGNYHLGEFLEDTWLIEWKIGTDKNGWVNIDDPVWRERVKANAAHLSDRP